MATQVDDLWPTELKPIPDQLPPITILKQQAALLGQRTKNLIEGQVETETSDYQRFLHHKLFLVAPALNFYRYALLDVEHHVTVMYPAKITVIWSDRKEPEQQELTIEAADEQQFKEALKRVFADEETKRVIGALLAQSMGEQGSSF